MFEFLYSLLVNISGVLYELLRIYIFEPLKFFRAFWHAKVVPYRDAIAGYGT